MDGWSDEKIQMFKSICRDQKPLGPIWIFLDKFGKNVETLFDEIRFKCIIDIRREIFSIVNGMIILYGAYPTIKQKVCERDLSRNWICMKTLL